MQPKTLLRHLDQHLANFSSSAIFLISLLGVIGVGVADYLVDVDISLSIFYFFPVGIATWYAGKRLGMVIGIFSTMPGVTKELVAGHYLIHPGIVAWNFILFLLTILVLVYLIGSLRSQIDKERTSI